MPRTQGELSLLKDPTAQGLLHSAIPARLAYIWHDGTPRVVPIWFHWNGSALVLAAEPASPKVQALRNRPAVALTIDDTTPPYAVLLIRGEASVELVDGMVPEYGLCAERYFGVDIGRAWANEQRRKIDRMARITIQPQWVGLIDFKTRFPQHFDTG